MPIDQSLKTTLQNAGLKATRARVAVLSLLARTAKPLSIQAIRKKLHKLKIDKATFYRMVESLKASGILRQVDFQHNHAHYELALAPHHHHIICINCNRTADVSNLKLETEFKKILQKNKDFTEIINHSLEIFALCKACKVTPKK